MERTRITRYKKKKLKMKKTVQDHSFDYFEDIEDTFTEDESIVFDFGDAWAYVRKGINDWEDDEEDEMDRVDREYND